MQKNIWWVKRRTDADTDAVGNVIRRRKKHQIKCDKDTQKNACSPPKKGKLSKMTSADVDETRM